MDVDTLKPILSALYARKCSGDLTGALQGHLRAIAKRGMSTVFTAKDMEKPFGLKYTATNEVLNELQKQGYIEETEPTENQPQRGRRSRLFRLTGAGRLATGVFQ